MMKRNLLSNVLIAMGVICVCLAAGMVVLNLREQQKADESAQQVLHSLKTVVTPVTEPAVEQTPVGVPPAATQPVEIPDYILNPNMNMPETEIDGVAYIGYLELTSLALELPVITRTTGSYLQISPCRFEGSAYLDNLVIGAHNYNRHFGQIGSLSYGDEIAFTDIDGNVFRYRVADIEILQPNQVELLCSGEWPLTLYTCTIGGRTRVTVRCEKME
ncbi:MAG: sortase [Oscillospiraceae bacterium]|nr:sortase [Oscillospiraceae bacterium]